MYKSILEQDLLKVIKDLGFLLTGDTLLSIPENPKFGDYSSNSPLQLAKQKHKRDYQTPLEIANDILERLGHPNYLERVEVAGGGFLNFYLKDEALIKGLWSRVEGIESKNPKKILVEYAHPNTHKEFHIGHLRNVSIGESISRLLEFVGNEVFRVTYGGDIGPHVAKAIWAVRQLAEDYLKAKKGSLNQKAHFLGSCYAKGALAYEKDQKAKDEIDQINDKLYQKDPTLMPIWEETKNWSIAYFDWIYSQVGTEFDRQIWESEVADEGKKIVEDNLGKVFIKDQGAIIFPGEKYGLHNRVFITGAGYPTYEGKEMGLTRLEMELFPYDSSIHVVASEQESFFEVTTKALEQIETNFKGKKRHLSYGMVNLTTGKMSSRLGNIITAEDLIDQVKKQIKASYSQDQDNQKREKIALAAIKFTYLQYSLVKDIVFDVEKSVALQGDTGPYLQYTYARIYSLREKAKKRDSSLHTGGVKLKLENEESEILRQLEYFQGAVEEAASKFRPNQLCSYLLNLAKAFNLFYERYPILGSERQEFRLVLSKKTAETLKLGLYLLGIEVLEKM